MTIPVQSLDYTWRGFTLYGLSYLIQWFFFNLVEKNIYATSFLLLFDMKSWSLVNINSLNCIIHLIVN
ncbi:MAG: hypothetical protein LKI39_07180, partial [Bacteroides sp.]|nr:hypothetical protein [Bacteroides sp.]